MKFIFVIMISVFMPISNVFAAGVITNVNNVGTYGSGRVFVELNASIPEPACQTARFDLDPNHSNLTKILSIVLSAQATGKQVHVKTNGCYAGYPTMDESTASYIYIIGN